VTERKYVRQVYYNPPLKLIINTNSIEADTNLTYGATNEGS